MTQLHRVKATVTNVTRVTDKVPLLYRVIEDYYNIEKTYQHIFHQTEMLEFDELPDEVHHDMVCAVDCYLQNMDSKESAIQAIEYIYSKMVSNYQHTAMGIGNPLPVSFQSLPETTKERYYMNFALVITLFRKYKQET